MTQKEMQFALQELERLTLIVRSISDRFYVNVSVNTVREENSFKSLFSGFRVGDYQFTMFDEDTKRIDYMPLKNKEPFHYDIRCEDIVSFTKEPKIEKAPRAVTPLQGSVATKRISNIQPIKEKVK